MPMAMSSDDHPTTMHVRGWREQVTFNGSKKATKKPWQATSDEQRSLGMYGIRIATHQMMPKRKIFAFSYEAIATGWRQPFELRRVFSCQLDTVRNTGAAIGVVSASTAFQIKQFAGDPGVIDAACAPTRAR